MPASTDGLTSVPNSRQSRRAGEIFRHRLSMPLPSIGSRRRDSSDPTPTDAITSLLGRPHSIDADEPRTDDASMHHEAASSIPRPPSRISRLGARVRQRYSMISQANDEASEHVDQNFQSSPVLSSRVPEQSGSAFRRRFSILGRLPRPSSRPSHGTGPRTRFGPISRPIPQTDDLELSPQFGVADASRRAPTPSILPMPSIASTSGQEDQGQGPVQVRRRSRLSRVRNSIFGIESLFRSSFHEASGDSQLQAPTRRPFRPEQEDDSDFLIPTAASQEPNADQDEALSRTSMTTERIEPMDALLEENSPLTPSAQTPLGEAGQDGREARRLPNLLRGRSSRMIRRDDETPLTHILQVAAAAIAAQLSGTTNALANLEAMGQDHFDGGLNAFVEELNNTTGQGQSSSTVREPNGQNPLNFWRVFRFANNQEIAHDGGEQQGQSPQDVSGGSGSRTVTVVVVGVRSVPSSSVTREGGQTVESGSLDTLLNFSDLPRAATPPSARSGGRLLRNITGRTRLPRSLTSESSSSSPLSRLQFASQHGASHPSRAAGAESQHRTRTSPSDLQSELHPSPFPPPPFTTSSPYHGSHSTGTARTSESLHSEMGNTLSVLGLNRLRRPSSMSTEQGTGGLRSRRRTDSDAHRHLENGFRDSRRNGVVAPEGSRSWLIYVVGTNLSEDHPALAASIFGEVCTDRLP